MRRRTRDRFILFALIGMTGILVDLVTVVVTEPITGYHVATIVGFVVATSWNYEWNYKVTWKQVSISHNRGWAQYVGTRLVPLVARLIVVTLLIDGMGTGVLLSSIVGIAVAGVSGFITADRFVFRADRQTT